MAYNIDTGIGQNLNGYSQKIYMVSEPRKVDSEETKAMARLAIEQYKGIHELIVGEVAEYGKDKAKCGQLKSLLNSITPLTETVSENLRNAQQKIVANFYLGDGKSPGLDYSQEAAKQMLSFLEMKDKLSKEITNHLKEVESAIDTLQNDFTNQITTKISNLRAKIEEYNNKPKD